MDRDSSQDSAVRVGGRVCARPGCGRLHPNKTYCSKRCRNIGEWEKLSPDAKAAKQRYMHRCALQQKIDRMLTRVRVLADTEEERCILAWQYGKRAANTAGWRLRRKGQGA